MRRLSILVVLTILVSPLLGQTMITTEDVGSPIDFEGKLVCGQILSSQTYDGYGYAVNDRQVLPLIARFVQDHNGTWTPNTAIAQVYSEWTLECYPGKASFGEAMAGAALRGIGVNRVESEWNAIATATFYDVVHARNWDGRIVPQVAGVTIGPLTGRGEAEGTVQVGASLGSGYGYGGQGMMGYGTGFGGANTPGLVPMASGYSYRNAGSGSMGSSMPGMAPLGSSWGGNGDFTGGISFSQTSGEYRIQLKAIEKAIEHLDPDQQPRRQHRSK